MGLRQLYFLLGGLLAKLVYLSYGLAIILGFIGVKLVLHALHENSLPFINGGEPVPVPEIGIAVSLSVIVGVLVITTIASLIKVRRDPEAVHDTPIASPLAEHDGPQAPPAPQRSFDRADEPGNARR
jgi:tellurite resistance protein TerC